MLDETTTDQSNVVKPTPMDEVAAPPANKRRWTYGPRFLFSSGGGSVKIELSPEALNVFNQIMNMTDDTPEDIIRKAISLYRVALEAHQGGNAVGSASTSNALDTEFVGF